MLGTTILHTICFMRERLDYKNIFMHGATKNIKIDIEWGKKMNCCKSCYGGMFRAYGWNQSKTFTER